MIKLGAKMFIYNLKFESKKVLNNACKCKTSYIKQCVHVIGKEGKKVNLNTLKTRLIMKKPRNEIIVV